MIPLKTPDEIERMRAACSAAAEVLAAVAHESSRAHDGGTE